uniref:Uncharacterized protein n=1 Tax=Setaria viridis TaxID=4556 RepID=A0A4U6VII5_SETVI|nr:hypothetical protein SEVIR_3G310500v2 [Setaria viridis]
MGDLILHWETQRSLCFVHGLKIICSANFHFLTPVKCFERRQVVILCYFIASTDGNFSLIFSLNPYFLC